jgi:hypothetical protein
MNLTEMTTNELERFLNNEENKRAKDLYKAVLPHLDLLGFTRKSNPETLSFDFSYEEITSRYILELCVDWESQLAFYTVFDSNGKEVKFFPISSPLKTIILAEKRTLSINNEEENRIVSDAVDILNTL